MDINRLKWASRRGMLELDLILLPFVENRYSELTESDQKRFEKLLLAEDTDLYAWFMGRAVPTDEDTRSIVECVRAFAQAPG